MRIKCENCMFEIDWVAVPSDENKMYFSAAKRVYYIEFATPSEAKHAFNRLSSEEESYTKKSYHKMRRCQDDVSLSDFLELEED